MSAEKLQCLMDSSGEVLYRSFVLIIHHLQKQKVDSFNKRWKGYMLFHFALHSNILHVCNLFFGFTLAFHEHSIMTLYMYKADKKALYIDEFASLVCIASIGLDI